ncbi:MAG TPA: thiamine pyrophosphate-dependent enzyme [Bacteroidales bacterium]|nr:thiamine pyrophosphate-dependent enzyme [Bacteroidales bacterium]
MALTELNGDQAFAWGALACGVKLVTSYPGSPSSGTVEELIKLAGKHDIYVEWSTNEKVAMEVGIGASIAGCRALVCTKSVGMNVMIDPLMALNLTPVKGGLVILLGDDPGGYSSQNDQDTRQIAQMLEMPVIEPAAPAEAYEMIQEAFRISEQLNSVVIIRETRSFTQQLEQVSMANEPYPQVNLGFKREPFRFVPVPLNAVGKHKELHDRLIQLGRWADGLHYNRIDGAGDYGIVGVGFAYRKIMDVLGDQSRQDVRLLKLSSIYPLPKKVISGFFSVCRKILVFEENEPFVEIHIKALAHDLGFAGRVYGKQSNNVHREGELYRWQITEALSGYLPGFTPAGKFLEENEAQERPDKESHCRGCGYGEILDKLEAAAESTGQKLAVIGDPGCLVTVAERLDAKFAIGSAVGVADGLSKAGCGERAVAVFGDSSFFHTTIPAICNAVSNRSDILMVVLDNKSSAASGHQTNPGVAKDAMGRETTALSIEKIARACGVRSVFSVGLEDIDSQLPGLFRDVLGSRELTMIIIQTPVPVHS